MVLKAMRHKHVIKIFKVDKYHFTKFANHGGILMNE